jgi:dihydropteroate synthase
MPARKQFRVVLPRGRLVLGKRTLLMGVLNVTPDSFSDGHQFLDPGKAIAHALRLESEGADLLDIGAESTRPGSGGIPAAEEMRRLLPVLEGLRGRLKIPISVDTRKADVAEVAIGAGAEMVNDISGFTHDPGLAEVAARYRVPVVAMHIRGTPETMQKKPFAPNALRDVTAGLRRSIAIARKAGIAKSQIILDPGIGFGKSFAQNYELLAQLPQLASLGCPLLVGTSRKGFLGRTLADSDGKARPASGRMWATAATVTAAILGGAHIVRVHEVAEMADVARTADCILNPAGRMDLRD